MSFSLNFILFLIIFIYLLFCFIKTRKEEQKKSATKPNKQVLEKSVTDYERLVVTAVLTAVMDKKKYRVKSIYPIGTVDEKKSSWKISGRLERMNARFFRKKY